MEAKQNVNTIGNFILNWDDFYRENYAWALRCISAHIPDLGNAKKVLDKIFMNLTLDSSLEDNTSRDFKNRLSIKLAGVIAAINRDERRKFYAQLENEKISSF